MLVLILAIGSVLVFLGVLALLWIADTLESRHIHQETMQGSQQPFLLLSVDQAFDPIYAVLWQAPVTALRFMESSGPPGIAVVRLLPIFHQAAQRFPEIYDGHNFLQWLQALEAARLIVWRGHRVALTEEGRAFLKHRFVKHAAVEI
jgi:hypothetical protein